MSEHSADSDVARLLLRIEYAVYANDSGLHPDRRADVMAAIRNVLTSERVIPPIEGASAQERL